MSATDDDAIQHRAGYDGAGQAVPTVEFDFDAIDKAEESRDCDEKCPIARKAAVEMLTRILDWIWQPKGPKNTNGIEIRAGIACWVFLRRLAPLNMAEIAACLLNRDKQSIGRWFDDFKIHFPYIDTHHMNRNPRPRPAPQAHTVTLTEGERTALDREIGRDSYRVFNP